MLPGYGGVIAGYPGGMALSEDYERRSRSQEQIQVRGARVQMTAPVTAAVLVTAAALVRLGWRGSKKAKENPRWPINTQKKLPVVVR